MNRAYALVWNPRTGGWSVADEHARRHGKGAGAILAASLLLAGPVLAADLPTGGQVVSGSGSISQPNAQQMVIDQASNKLAIDWQSFDIGAGNKVTFNQPGRDSIALNRVIGSDGSKIMGQLDANGRVFLVNPNGVLFGNGASVNVGGLVASSLDLSVEDFDKGQYRFQGDGSPAAVVNQGNIRADGGAVALLGGTVSNNGVIVANQGSVTLAAGNAMTLDFAGDGLLNVQVDEAAVDALVENHQLIKADGGQVVLTANAGDALLKTVVNNTGVIEARTLGEKNGKILLLGDFDGGVVNVAGTLDASAPTGGDGGFIDTSGAHVKIADDVKVTTLAPKGKTGEWLIDPYNVTISNAPSSGMGGFNGNANDSVLNVTTLTNALASTGVTVTTGVGGSQAGNITVDAAISWSANTVLTLNAAGSVIINKDITATGSNAGLALLYNGGYSLNKGARVTLSGHSASLSLGGTSYTLIRDIGTLQTIGSSGFYALGNDIDASATAGWNGGAGFNPLDGVSGTFTGLGHSIDKLTIARGLENDVGLFRSVSGSVRDLTLSNATITGQQNVGGVTATLGGNLSNVHLTGSVVGAGVFVGGLAGSVNNGTIRYSSSAADVVGLAVVGGLAGNVQNITVADSYSTGSVTATVNNTGAYAGGLLGEVSGSATLTNTYASGKISGYTATGGLIGGGFLPTITVNNSYWDINSTGQSTSLGGGTGLSSGVRNQASYLRRFRLHQHLGDVRGRYPADAAQRVLHDHIHAPCTAADGAESVRQLPPGHRSEPNQRHGRQWRLLRRGVGRVGLAPDRQQRPAVHRQFRRAGTQYQWPDHRPGSDQLRWAVRLHLRCVPGQREADWRQRNWQRQRRCPGRLYAGRHPRQRVGQRHGQRRQHGREQHRRAGGHQRRRCHRRCLRQRQCHRRRLPDRRPGRLQCQRRQHYPLLCHR
jgi:filamentous hemagglutinin family protein